MGVRIYSSGEPDFRLRLERLRDALRADRVTGGAAMGEAGAARTVSDIISDVRVNGDGALLSLTEKFDGVRLAPDRLRVGDVEIRAARAKADRSFIRLIRRAADNIRKYQRRVLVKVIGG